MLNCFHIHEYYVFIHAIRYNTYNTIKMKFEFQCLRTQSSELILVRQHDNVLVFIIHAAVLDLLGTCKIGIIILGFCLHFLFG